jgi:plasmid stability protein
MRTTLTLDDELARALRAEAARSGRPFKEVVDETLRAGLATRGRAPRPRGYRLEPASLGRVRPGIDLDKALELSDRLEDEEIGRELELQK